MAPYGTQRRRCENEKGQDDESVITYSQTGEPKEAKKERIHGTSSGTGMHNQPLLNRAKYCHKFILASFF